MSKKIIQIIPAPSGMYAEYRTDEGEIEHIPVVSLMLVDDGGTRYIEAATFDEEYGVYDEPEQFGNFIRYVMETPNFPTGPQF